jgi:hypothetical protein
MDRNNTKNSVVEKSKSHKGKKKLDASASKSRRTNASKKIKAKTIVVLSSSSSSDDTDEDYAEFLKTYDPQEYYPYDSPSGDEGSQITLESKAKAPTSSKARTSK